MSNIFNSMTKHFGPRQHIVNTESYQPARKDSARGLIVLGYSVVYLDPKSQSHVNNFDNL
jgi:hypothetical protein